MILGIAISTPRKSISAHLSRKNQPPKPPKLLNFQVNFDVSIELDGRRIPLNRLSSNELHWCGFLIDTDTLEIRPSLLRLLERPLHVSVTMDRYGCIHLLHVYSLSQYTLVMYIPYHNSVTIRPINVYITLVTVVSSYSSVTVYSSVIP